MDKARKLLKKKLLRGEAMDEARRPLLKKLDKNGDAIMIRMCDLKDTLVAIGIEPTSEELEDMMKKLNKNGGDDDDGYIKMEELLEYYEENNVAWKRLKKELEKKSLWLAKMTVEIGRELIWYLFLDIVGYACHGYAIRDCIIDMKRIISKMRRERRESRSQQKSAHPSPTSSSSSSVGASPS